MRLHSLFKNLSWVRVYFCEELGPRFFPKPTTAKCKQNKESNHSSKPLTNSREHNPGILVKIIITGINIHISLCGNHSSDNSTHNFTYTCSLKLQRMNKYKIKTKHIPTQIHKGDIDHLFYSFFLCLSPFHSSPLLFSHFFQLHVD